MLMFIVCLGAAMLAVLLMERLVKPRVDRRPIIHRISLLSAMPTLVFYVSIFMVSYRPVYSLVASIVVFATIVVVNNAKYAALKEPLVFSDFALLREAINHPALYVKYVGVWKLIAVALAAAGSIAAGMTLENPVIQRRELDDYFPAMIYAGLLFGLIYAVTRGPLRTGFRDLLRRFGPSADIRRDIDALGLVVCLILYFFFANEPSTPKPEPSARQRRRLRPKVMLPDFERRLPDVVAVQSESFFDARRLHPSIDRGVLARYDQCVAESAFAGRLEVPAWGANTMRTEFAFLSGLPNAALAYHRFNPYLRLRRRPAWTMAHQLRLLGYRTVVIHPFSAEFFDRRTVFPNLGFDVFLDIEDFRDAPTYGPYVCDTAVADKIVEVLGEWDGPQFVFAITMENHGKWEEDRLAASGHAPLADASPLGSWELGLYLAHLRNTDRLVGTLCDALNARPHDAVFGLFGDHVPSLPKVFNSVRYDDPRTDYFVWRKGGGHPCRFDATADALGRLVLDTVLTPAGEEPVAAGDAATAIAGE